jgi:ATP-dependent helicase/nuclease subunit A
VRTMVGDSFAAAKRLSNAQRIVAAADEFASLLDDATPPLTTVQERIAELLPANLMVHLGKWASGMTGDTERDYLGAAAESLPGPAGELLDGARFLASLDPEFYGRARRVLGPLLERVHEGMRRRGAIPFSGLLAEAAHLLAASPEARDRLRRGIDQLLVDEFQDTDRLQCEIVRLIALDGPVEERPGLFLVGDPKQSIYGWRNADLRAWDEFLQLVEVAGGERRFLHVNYRSVATILDEVERCAADVMIEAPGVQPPFRPLVAWEARRELPGFVTDQHRPVEHWIVDGATHEAEEDTDVLELEAAAMARDVRELHDTHEVGWHTVAVLLRTTTALDVVLRALQDAGVPYAVERDRAYFQRREVIEATALVRTVLDPADHLALLTVWRSPLVGVPDAALIPLWRHQLPATLTELSAPDMERLEEMEATIASAAAETATDVPGIERLAGWPAALITFVRTLADLRAAFEIDSPDRFVERLRSATLLEAGEGARRLGAFRLANLDRLLRRLAETLGAGGDVQAVLRVLRRSVTEAREAEEARPLGASDDAVRVMTVHRAKGLTFDHVYLLQAARGSRSGATDTTAAELVADGWGLLLLGAPNPAWAEVSAHRRRVERAERVRTLYVALTRARERLVVSGRGVPKEPVPLPRAATHDDLLSHRRATPTDLAERLAGAGAFTDDHGVRWMRPPKLGEQATFPRGTEHAVADAGRVTRDIQRLRVAAADAAARMLRPWRTAASSEAHRLLPAGAEGGDASALDTARDLAAAVGTAVHASLERLAEPFDERALAVAVAAPRAALKAAVGAGDAMTAMTRFDEHLKRLVGGPLWPRLQQRLAAAVARELPVLLRPADDAGPVGYIAGVVDLLYRDPQTGTLVVADYKTDAVEPGPDLEDRVAAYALQGRVYVRAVQEALRLATTPRFELWFLAADRIVTPLA